MAKGASGIGGGSGAGASPATAPAFDSNNWRTWQKGTKVQIGEEDIGFADGIGRRGAMRLEDATVTDIYDDHIMVTTEDGTRHWIDDDTVDIVKSATNSTRNRDRYKRSR